MADSLFPGVGKATVDVLERQGVEVGFDPGQTCCGQMHLNTGYQPEASALVDHFVERYAAVEAVVMPSGSCAAMRRHHHQTVSPGSALPSDFELGAPPRQAGRDRRRRELSVHRHLPIRRVTPPGC